MGVLPRICLANAAGGEGQMRMRCATSGGFTPQSIETSDAKRCTSSTVPREMSACRLDKVTFAPSNTNDTRIPRMDKSFRKEVLLC